MQSIEFVYCGHVVLHCVNPTEHFLTDRANCLTLMTALMMGERVPVGEHLATCLAWKLRNLGRCLQSRKVWPQDSICSPLGSYRKENSISKTQLRICKVNNYDNFNHINPLCVDIWMVHFYKWSAQSNLHCGSSEHSVLEKLLVPQLVTKFLTFYMGSQGLLVRSQGCAIFNPEPDVSSPHPAKLCL